MASVRRILQIMSATFCAPVIFKQKTTERKRELKTGRKQKTQFLTIKITLTRAALLDINQ